MRRVFKTNVFINKKNKQISIVIPKSKIKIFKKRTPKTLKLEIKEIEWWGD